MTTRSAAIQRASDQVVGKRQVEQLAQRTAVDFEGFYAARQTASYQTVVTHWSSRVTARAW